MKQSHVHHREHKEVSEHPAMSIDSNWVRRVAFDLQPEWNLLFMDTGEKLSYCFKMWLLQLKRSIQAYMIMDILVTQK